MLAYFWSEKHKFKLKWPNSGSREMDYSPECTKYSTIHVSNIVSFENLSKHGLRRLIISTETDALIITCLLGFADGAEHCFHVQM